MRCLRWENSQESSTHPTHTTHFSSQDSQIVRVAWDSITNWEKGPAPRNIWDSYSLLIPKCTQSAVRWVGIHLVLPPPAKGSPTNNHTCGCVPFPPPPISCCRSLLNLRAGLFSTWPDGIISYGSWWYRHMWLRTFSRRYGLIEESMSEYSSW